MDFMDIADLYKKMRMKDWMTEEDIRNEGQLWHDLRVLLMEVAKKYSDKGEIQIAFLEDDWWFLFTSKKSGKLRYRIGSDKRERKKKED